METFCTGLHIVLIFVVNYRWFDVAQDDGCIERELELNEDGNSPAVSPAAEPSADEPSQQEEEPGMQISTAQISILIIER